MAKYTTTPEELDVAQTAKVTVDLRALRAVDLRELKTNRPLAFEQGRNAVTIQVGPGDIRIVQIPTAD